MKGKPLQLNLLIGMAAACIAWCAGCGPVDVEQREARDRHLRRAYAAKAAQDIDGAIAHCEKALARRPELALAHRELGLMLDNYRQDYVPALYHYQRYLELRPDSENRPAVEELIQHCRLSFAGQIAASPEDLKRSLQARDERIRKLELEVAALRERAGGGARPEPPVPATAPAEARPATPGPAVQTHVVQAGENLATISTRYYGTPAKWKAIFNANSKKLTDANNLRVGTQLEIPAQ